MNNLDIKALIESKTPGYFDKFPNFITTIIIKFLEHVIHLKEINQFLEKNADKKGIEFIDELFDTYEFGYMVSSNDQLRIPAEGRVLIVANHPLGALDGLAIIKAVSQIRPDIKVIANDILVNIDNIQDLLLPFDVFSTKYQKSHIEKIKNAILNEEAILFFPAAEVSRPSLNGIRDRKWLNGPVFFAHKYHVPILPIHIKGKNSAIFYTISYFFNKFSMFLLPREIFKKSSTNITLKIGDPIPSQHFKTNIININYQTKLLRKHVYQIGRKKTGVFKTEKTIIHPIDRRLIKSELVNSQLLTLTPDDKQIYMVDYNNAKNVVKEIARLREVTFRKVGEGTGLKYDFDEYDRHYKHVVLWDEDGLEIIGSYRLCICKDVIEKYGKAGLYNYSLFNFSNDFDQYLDKALELGRSFIQQKYWKSNALDHLWLGIGAFVSQQSNIEYLFGAVSISDYYSDEAKNLIVGFYKKWYSDKDKLAMSKNRFILTKKQAEEITQILTGNTYAEDFRILKSTLKTLGYTIPVLFRRYSELCERDGVRFMDFGVDEDFSNVVDGLVMLDLNKLLPSKRKRYYRVLSNKVEKVFKGSDIE